MTSNYSKNYSKNYSSNCLNCGKIGHILKDCEEPVTSVGIVCFRLNKTIYKTFLQNLSGISYYDLSNLILNNIHLFNTYNDMIEFMLVKRRHSLNYIEFIRGKYDPCDIERIESMFSLMNIDEVEMIKNKEFNYLWNNLWMKNAHKKKYMVEFNQSKNKFNIFRSYDMSRFISEYKDTEWEIPKGRKNSNEKNIDCAVREFREETSITNDDYIVISSLDPIHDTFTGTNGKQYRHIFYTSLINNDNIEKEIDHHNNEIELVRWCKWSELNDIIRPYNNNKINIFTSVLIFIMNVCEHNNDIPYIKN
jgi:8-oxo-dGTP pyrophosphatase MutT (NUDIX family)